MKYFFLFLFTWSILCFGNDRQFICMDKILKHYSRQMTVLIVKENGHEFASRIASIHDGIFVLLDSQSAEKVYEATQNSVYLSTHYSPEILLHLSESEHFDVVYVECQSDEFNESFVNTLYKLGEHVFVYVNNMNQRALFQLRRRFNKIQGQTAFFYKYHHINFLLRTNWLQEPSMNNRVREIHSNFSKKEQHKKIDPYPLCISKWVPGINLMTFKMLYGTYPTNSQLEREFRRLWNYNHPDWMPNNIIVQGKRLEMIDYDDPNLIPPKTVHSHEMLNLMLSFAKETITDRVIDHFNKILEYCRKQIHGEEDS